jgi:hypothetical protein
MPLDRHFASQIPTLRGTITRSRRILTSIGQVELWVILTAINNEEDLLMCTTRKNMILII